MQKIAMTFQTNLINATNDGARQAAAETAIKGIKVYTEIHDKMQQIISGGGSIAADTKGGARHSIERSRMTCAGLCGSH